MWLFTDISSVLWTLLHSLLSSSSVSELYLPFLNLVSFPSVIRSYWTAVFTKNCYMVVKWMRFSYYFKTSEVLSQENILMFVLKQCIAVLKNNLTPSQVRQQTCLHALSAGQGCGLGTSVTRFLSAAGIRGPSAGVLMGCRKIHTSEVGSSQICFVQTVGALSRERKGPPGPTVSAASSGLRASRMLVEWLL